MFVDYAGTQESRRLGQDDHLVSWPKPQRPAWMSPEEYAALPDELTLREVRITVKPRGFRTKSLVVVTTLLGRAMKRGQA